MPAQRSTEPNFFSRWVLRSMPSCGTQSLRKYGRQRTSTGTSGTSASAFSRRRLPMKHHGQTTSETTSIDMTGAGGGIGKGGAGTVGGERRDRVLQIADGEAIAADAHDAVRRAIEHKPAGLTVDMAGEMRVDDAIRPDSEIELRAARTAGRAGMRRHHGAARAQGAGRAARPHGEIG